MKGITFVKAFFKFIILFFIIGIFIFLSLIAIFSFLISNIWYNLSFKRPVNCKEKISPCQIYFSRIFFKIVQAKKVPDINFLKAFDFIEYYRGFCIVYAPLCVFFALLLT